MSHPIDQRFRAAFENWAPPTPPRKQGFDQRVRASFASFKVRPARSWTRSSGHVSTARSAWPVRIFAFGAVLILAVLAGLSVPDPPALSFNAPLALDFIPEGPIYGITPDLPSFKKNPASASALIPTGQREHNPVAVEKTVAEMGVPFPADENESQKKQSPLEISWKFKPELIERTHAGYAPLREKPNLALAVRANRWKLDLRFGLNWGIMGSHFEMPQQLSLGKTTASHQNNQGLWAQVGLRRQVGQQLHLMGGIHFNMQRHEFSRALLHYAPLNSIAVAPHSNIISPLGPVSGLTMNVDYYAPESESLRLNADSILGNPMQGIGVNRAELSLALGIMFQPRSGLSISSKSWGWRGEAFLFPGLMVLNRAVAYSDEKGIEAGEIQGLNLFTLSGSLSFSLVHTRPSGLSYSVGPTLFTRLNSSNYLPGGAGVPISLGFQLGITF